jgi:hypothetical protein
MADASRPRWYHLTPDRVVLGLLAVEGFLLLSEWFAWFPFNRHKGYTVVVAVAVVAVAFLLMLFWFLAALLFRLRFQFSIRALLLLALVVAIPFSWLATEMKEARAQHDVVVWIEKAGGTVHYDYQLDPSGDEIPGAKPPGPAWLRKMLGDDLLVDLRQVHLSSSEVSDDDLKRLEALARLQRLDVDYTKVADAGLEHLQGLRQLKYLELSETKVTDAGVKRLQQILPHCEIVQWMGIAGIGGIDRITSMHIENLLASKGIECEMMGSITWGFASRSSTRRRRSGSSMRTRSRKATGSILAGRIVRMPLRRLPSR